MSTPCGKFKVYSPVFMDIKDLETTGQVILPQEIITRAVNDNRLEGLTNQGAMHFQFRNPVTKATIYAGVREFKGDCVVMPHWMMNFICVDEDTYVEVSFANLRKATRVLFQPSDDDFNKLNVRAVLEVHLRTHFCLTQGTNLPINFGRRTYLLKVLKTEPDPAVLLFHSDVVTDFAPPESTFNHQWNESDTDSSENDVTVNIGHTITGKYIQDRKKPIHSTVASRKENLKTNPAIMGVRKFQQGQEVTAPKPKVKEDQQSQENLFIGEAHMLKNKVKAKKPKKGKAGKKGSKKESQQEVQQDEIAVPDKPDKPDEPSPQDTNPFKGSARTLKSPKGSNIQNDNNKKISNNDTNNAQINNTVAPQNPLINKAPVPPSNLPKKEEYNPFGGKPRSLRDKK